MIWSTPLECLYCKMKLVSITMGKHGGNMEAAWHHLKPLFATCGQRQVCCFPCFQCGAKSSSSVRCCSCKSHFALPPRVFKAHPGSHTQGQILTAHVLTRHPPHLLVFVSYLSLHGTWEARALWQHNSPIVFFFSLWVCCSLFLCGCCLIVHLSLYMSCHRVGVLVLSSCYMAFKIVALEHRLNSLVSTGEHIRNE